MSCRPEGFNRFLQDINLATPLAERALVSILDNTSLHLILFEQEKQRERDLLRTRMYELGVKLEATDND